MREKIREKGKAEAPKTLKMPVFSRVLDLKLDKFGFSPLFTRLDELCVPAFALCKNVYKSGANSQYLP